ncbi:Uma2 family endonuclease [Amycolatopsis endophytica]|uniref:Uma2 family endonuclease n=1 Tax=Amycolatopsis endophytica TaxID=860233 RepID=A0A853AX28_9PSEU|nr:Uma2 family endonuclease [Amycolatopsis endophytica]NYI87146.1 Uma2 family endonuclease [Amycolatopsis endophytica]
MTALPEWMVLPPDGLTAADYEALPEEVCRSLEIVDGAIVVNPAPRRAHQIFARRLANALEDAAPEEWEVATDVDLRLRDVPLLNRRPDLVVYDASLDEDAVLRPEHCVLVVEVMSPGSITADQTDKPAEYAHARIPHFWRVEGLDRGAISLFRYRLDPTTGLYATDGVNTGKVTVAEPFAAGIDLAELL